MLKKRGFTLIELIVAMAVSSTLSLLALSLWGYFHKQLLDIEKNYENMVAEDIRNIEQIKKNVFKDSSFQVLKIRYK